MGARGRNRHTLAVKQLLLGGLGAVDGIELEAEVFGLVLGIGDADGVELILAGGLDDDVAVVLVLQQRPDSGNNADTHWNGGGCITVGSRQGNGYYCSHIQLADE